MKEEKRFLVDVGVGDLPFPIKALSRSHPEGQPTIANISINARLMHEFEAGWIDRFIQIVHRHREKIGPQTLRENIGAYLKELNATMVRISFDFPFFIEKTTPVDKEKCLVKYMCNYSAKIPSIDDSPKVFFNIKVPCITTYPNSDPGKPGGLFGQLSTVMIETESKKDFYAEDLVELVDRHALTPIFSFLTEKDQQYVINKIHSEKKTSVEMVDDIKDELARNKALAFYSVRCHNYGLLHSYNTVISTEKSIWAPFSDYEDDTI